MQKTWKTWLAICLSLAMLVTCLPMTSARAAESVSATGQVYNVAGEGAGSDMADGSEQAPYRTFQKAAELVKPGDTIILHKGIYNVDRAVHTWKGTADKPITIKGCDDPNCEICKSNASLPGPVFTSKSDYTNKGEKATSDYMLKLVNSSYVNISRLYITGYTGAGLWPVGCDHLNFSTMWIWDIDMPEDTDAGTEAILVNDTTDSTFKDIIAYDIGQTRRSQGDHGIYVGGATNCVFDGVLVQDAPGSGIQFYTGDNYAVTAKNCTIQNCVLSGCKYGLILTNVDGFTISNNTIYNSGNTDVYMDWTATNNLIQNNLFYNDRTEQYEDPKYGKEDPAIIGYQWSTVKTDGTKTVTGNTFRNNLCDYCGKFSAICRYGTLTADKKGVDLVPYSIADFATMQNAAPEKNTVTNLNSGDAKIYESIDTANLPKGDAYEERIFENAGNAIGGYLDIQAGSACIDAGVSDKAPALDTLGTSRNGAVDIGAYEYVPGGLNVEDSTDLDGNVVEVPGVSYMTDISGHWAEEAIAYAAQRKLVSGYTDGNFYPDRTITRAEFVAIMDRVLGLNTDDTTSSFSDVKSTDWYAGAVNAGATAKIISGMGDGTFAPQKNITREEAMVVLTNVLDTYEAHKKGDETVLSGFSDQNTISSWARGSVTNLVGWGVISGSNGKINPKNNMTRAEVCQVLYKMYTLLLIK